MREFSNYGPILTDDALRNANCHEYLSLLAEKVRIPKEISKPLIPYIALLREFESHRVYNKDYPYGNLYNLFLCIFQRDLADKSITDLPVGFIKSIFANPNNAIRRAAKAFSENKAKALPSVGSPVNKHTPNDADSTLGKLFPMLSLTVVTQLPTFAAKLFEAVGITLSFNPMAMTNLPSVCDYAYKNERERRWSTELRMGTQVVCLDGKVLRINPCFAAFLESIAPEEMVYFNCLGRDVSSKHIGVGFMKIPMPNGEIVERRNESEMTRMLHEAEKRHKNLIVITLPSDKGLMHKKLFLSDKKINLKAAKEKMFAIAAGKPCDEIIKDFYISEAAKKKIFGSQKEAIINALLEKSFKLFQGKDYDKAAEITAAQHQAIYFHFIKFELTNFVLEKIDPDYCNFTCKDGIDRGRVASLYYNLIKSILSGNPMPEEEFLAYLNGPAINVKGREINEHRDILWNVIHHLINAGGLVVPDWLIRWRDNNIPEALAKKMASPLSSPASSSTGSPVFLSPM